MCYGEEHTSCITIHLTNSTLLHIHCWYKCISVHATMKQLNSLTEGNSTTLLGQFLHFIEFEELSQVEHKLQQTTSDDHRKTTFPLVNSHCSVRTHCFHYEAESEQLLRGLSMLPTKVECCPTAHEVRETQWNLMGLTYLLVVYYINSCTYVHVQTTKE